jgi:leader peptidase (prepilin peptidase)/N-methyltransferase
MTLLFSTVILGLVIGSFLNVVIVRLPQMADCREINVLYPRSYCIYCQQKIAYFDNIPLLSFLLLRGQCRHCKNPISFRYPLVEALTACLSSIVVAKFGMTLTALGALVLTWVLITLSCIDLEHTLLPDTVTLPFTWIGLLFNLNNLFQPLQACVLGAVVGYLSLWSVYWIFKLISGKEGMGYGDFKLLGMLGAWLGWQAILPILLLSSLLGSIYGISLIMFKTQDRHTPFAFGPFLSIGGFVVLLLGSDLMQWYFRVVQL